MSNYQYAVLVGPPMEEQRLYGPFPTFEHAQDWTVHEVSLNEYTWIVELEEPMENAS